MNIKPTLTLVLCSTKNNYDPGSVWRLETALNYLARNIHILKMEKDIEILVTDWASKIPLSQILQPSPEVARLTSFIYVPAQIAEKFKQTHKSTQAIALNAAIRRSRGEYIGKIGQDTLVGRKFLQEFFRIYQGRKKIKVPLNKALLFANCRNLPLPLSLKAPSLQELDKFISYFGRLLFPEHYRPRLPYWTSFAGIWLLHRDIWQECTGYDERLDNPSWTEVEMILRLKNKYKLINFGRMVNYDFYHLEQAKKRLLKEIPQVNPVAEINSPLRSFAPNGNNWGLGQYSLDLHPVLAKQGTVESSNKVTTRISWLGQEHPFINSAVFSITQRLHYRFRYLRWLMSRRVVERYRFVTASLRALPDVLIIGGQRCGTSTLYYNLIKHPNIRPALKKEIHFFTAHYKKGINWYRSNFPLAIGKQLSRITGKPSLAIEATPFYLFDMHAPKRIFQYLPNIKLIVLLRNPLDRAFSNYRMCVGKGLEPLSFEQAIKKEEQRIYADFIKRYKDEHHLAQKYWRFCYKSRGIYDVQLKRWSAYFKKENMLVLQSEEYFKNPQKVYEQILKFLSLPLWLPDEFIRPGKTSSDLVMEEETRKWLSEYFKPHNQRLFEYLGRRFDWEK